MRIRVLGAAAGGGFPQWNCACRNCSEVRSGCSRTKSLTQEAVAISADGERWFLLNASPEIRAQIESFPALHPRGPRHSPIAAILLTNGDLDHCLGLLSLRESHPIVIYATGEVRRGFTEGNVFYRTLERFPGQATWRTLERDRETALIGADGRPGGLWVRAVAAPGKPPIHLEGPGASRLEQNVGMLVRDPATNGVLAYFSSAGAVTPEMLETFAGANCLFFDGTFWSSDELITLGLGTQRAQDMAHLPVGGPGGSLEALAGVRAPRRIFIHINNTNPLLRPDSAERRQVEAAGWEIAEDGMEFAL